MNFPKDLAVRLDGELTELTLNTNLTYNSKIPDNNVIPDLFVAIYSSSPKKASRNFSNKCEVRYKAAMILVRSGNESGNYEAAEDLCDKIYTTLQSKLFGDYQDVVFKSDFSEGNKDEQNRYTWTASIEAWYNRNP